MFNYFYKLVFEAHKWIIFRLGPTFWTRGHQPKGLGTTALTITPSRLI